MKKIATTIFILLISVPIFSQTSIHYWDFNAGASATSGMKWPSPVAATSTVNYGSITHTFDNTDNFSGSAIDASGFSSTAGDAFCVVGSNNNTVSFIINASTLGFKDIQLTYATRGTASGFSDHTIDYSLDGINYTNKTTITGRTTTSFSLQTISFVSLTAANNNPNFKIRITLSGATSSSGNNRFDNIRITGTVSPCSPTNQPTSLLLNPSFNSLTGSFTAAAPGSINASAYLVLISTSSSLGSQPANGQVYNADDVIGNGIVVDVSASTNFTVNSLIPGTTYYFFIYSYDNTTDCYNLVSPLTGNVNTTTPPACSPPSVQCSSLSSSNLTSSSIDLSYARGNGDKILVIASAGSAVNQSPINSVSYSEGSQIGTGNYVIYNGAASSYSYTYLLSNTAYYFALYEYNDAGLCYNSSPLTGNFTTACSAPVNATSFNSSAGNHQVSLTWTNPSSGSCYDQVLVIASATSIAGQGSDYAGTASTAYSSGPQVVYRAMGNSVIVTGLTNNTTYYFKVFTRLGGSWSAGVQVSALPYDPSAGYQYLFGNLHAHSSYSDGNKDNTAKTPKDDYEFARDANCMDFLGISEHNHSGAGMSRSDFLTGYSQANLVNGVSSPSTGNSIVTLWGMEWGVISNGGHALVYGFNDQLIGWESGNYDTYVAKNDYSSLWNAINNNAQAFATLAHPNSSDYNGLVSSYNSSADNAVVGCAVESGPAFSLSTSYDDFPSSLSFMGYFKSLLAKGYHVAPQMDHDNHNMTFGTVNTDRTVVLASAKTREAIMEALKARRYYASQDCNARVEFKANQDPMGSIITRGGLPSLSLLVTDPDGEAVNKIELWGGAIGASVPPSPIKTWTSTTSITFSSANAENIQPNGSPWYYFAIITQADGNKIVTAPIWFTRSDITLPVTLINFNGTWSVNKNEIMLNWLTAREINTDKFIIQRSTDKGATWSDIGMSIASGTSDFNQTYSFTDKQPLTENWYRLKMIDIDNGYTYSKITMLTASTISTISYTIYPNPATDFINIISSSSVLQSVTARIIDNNGRILTARQLVTSASRPVVIPVGNFNPGNYYLVINDGKMVAKKMFVIAEK